MRAGGEKVKMAAATLPTIVDRVEIGAPAEQAQTQVTRRSAAPGYLQQTAGGQWRAQVNIALRKACS